MTYNLTGKVALVTGGSSGIGRAAALAFAEAGAKVIVVARDEERGEEAVRQVKEAGGQALFVPTDVSKADEVRGMVSKVVETYGRLDCAFNNAASSEGTFNETADFEEAEFYRVMDTNLKGVWLSMKHEIRQMLRQDPIGGAIVNTSSANGLGGAREGALYSASKAGVLALTKSAAQEYAQRGIRVNALVAGAFRTPMLEGLIEGAARTAGIEPEQLQESYESMIPMGRIGSPGGGRSRHLAMLTKRLLRNWPLHDRRRRLDGVR